MEAVLATAFIIGSALLIRYAMIKLVNKLTGE